MMTTRNIPHFISLTVFARRSITSSSDIVLAAAAGENAGVGGDIGFGVGVGAGVGVVGFGAGTGVGAGATVGVGVGFGAGTGVGAGIGAGIGFGVGVCTAAAAGGVTGTLKVLFDSSSVSSFFASSLLASNSRTSLRPFIALSRSPDFIHSRTCSIALPTVVWMGSAIGDFVIKNI